MISIISPDHKNPQTGGQKYNYQLYEIIQKHVEPMHVKLFLDKDLKTTSISFLFNLIYLFKIKRIKNKLLLFDSRMYPRLVIFLLFFRILSPKTFVVATHHHFSYKTRRNLFGKMLAFVFEVLTLKLAHEVIVPSSFTLALSKKILRKERIVYIPLGFESDNVVFKNRKLEYPIKLLNVGTVSLRKRTHLLVEIMAKLPKGKFEMHMVGNYSEADNYYQNMCKEIQKQQMSECVFFHGRLNDKELDQLYSEASLFTFTSQYEGFGMVMVEAMQRGMPVVAFNNSAIPYVIKDGETGLLTEDGNITDFVAQIKSICSDESVYQKYSINAFNHAQSFPNSSYLESVMTDWIVTKKRTL